MLVQRLTSETLAYHWNNIGQECTCSSIYECLHHLHSVISCGMMERREAVLIHVVHVGDTRAQYVIDGVHQAISGCLQSNMV